MSDEVESPSTYHEVVVKYPESPNHPLLKRKVWVGSRAECDHVTKVIAADGKFQELEEHLQAQLVVIPSTMQPHEFIEMRETWKANLSPSLRGLPKSQLELHAAELAGNEFPGEWDYDSEDDEELDPVLCDLIPNYRPGMVDRDQVEPVEVVEKSDLDHLHDWAIRIEGPLAELEKAERCLCEELFLPHPRASDALIRLSIQYPEAIKELQLALDFAKQAFFRFQSKDLDADDVLDAMEILARKIRVAVEAMRAKTQADVQPGPNKSESLSELRIRAEKYVKKQNGNFHGVRPLARILKCPIASLDKAIKKSFYLKARKAEHMEARKHGSTQSLDSVLLSQVSQDREVHPAEALDQLIAEQQKDDKSDVRMGRVRSRSGSRS